MRRRDPNALNPGPDEGERARPSSNDPRRVPRGILIGIAGGIAIWIAIILGLLA